MWERSNGLLHTLHIEWAIKFIVLARVGWKKTPTLLWTARDASLCLHFLYPLDNWTGIIYILLWFADLMMYVQVVESRQNNKISFNWSCWGVVQLSAVCLCFFKIMKQIIDCPNYKQLLIKQKLLSKRRFSAVISEVPFLYSTKLRCPALRLKRFLWHLSHWVLPCLPCLLHFCYRLAVQYTGQAVANSRIISLAIDPPLRRDLYNPVIITLRTHQQVNKLQPSNHHSKNSPAGK